MGLLTSATVRQCKHPTLSSKPDLLLHSADKTGYLVGSIEGRVAVNHVEESVGNTKNFTFKCHRDNNDIYSVNDIRFHPVHGTFVTAGSDG